MRKSEFITWAAVGIGAFSIPYIITTLIMKKDNLKEGYPYYLKGDKISL